MTRVSLRAGLIAALACSASAQAQQPQIGQLYQCTDGHSAMKVLRCSNGNGAQCDVELSRDGQVQQSGRVPAAGVLDLMRVCQGNGAAAGQPPGAAAAGGADANGFKIGDTVRINTAFGWMDAKILKANGDSYYVHSQSGADVWKPYPQDLRRVGPLNDQDRARGLYALHEKVEANVEGRWVPGEVVMEMNGEYQVELGDRRTAWARPQHLRRVAVTEKPAAPAAGQPPKPGMVSCAGKIEGRYSASGVGSFTIVFRQGKATIKMYGGNDDTVDCWISERHILLHKPGEEDSMPIEINDDGTLDTPMGEVRKKSS